jgi:type 1 glutamine amidotransferase
MSDPTRVHFVCGGRWHDMDFARVEILKLLGEHPTIRTRVAEDYSNLKALAKADFLLTYTCDLEGVTDAEQEALARFVSKGGRWIALHGTNSVMEFIDGGAGGVATPRTHPILMKTLGSQFLAHPPIGPIQVTNVAPSHPLVKGIDDFEVSDELYLCEYHGENHSLLETRYTGKAAGFKRADWPDDEARLVMYLHPEGRGEVLYLTLGHCRGKYDMRPMIPLYPVVERGSWELPVFYELLRRGIRWAARGLDAV